MSACSQTRSSAGFDPQRAGAARVEAMKPTDGKAVSRTWPRFAGTDPSPPRRCTALGPPGRGRDARPSHRRTSRRGQGWYCWRVQFKAGAICRSCSCLCGTPPTN